MIAGLRAERRRARPGCCCGSSPPGSRPRCSTPSVSMAVSSFTTRRAAAAVGVVLVLFVPAIAARSVIESAGAPDALDLLSLPFVASELSYRIFGEDAADGEPIEQVSTWLVAAGLLAWIARRRGRVLAPLPANRGVPMTEPRRRRRGRVEVVRRARRGLGRQLRDRPRRDRAARPERRRQVDDAADALRARPALQGHGPRARPRPAHRRRRHPLDRPRAAAGERLRVAHGASEFLRLSATLHGLRGSRRRRERPPSRRSGSTRPTRAGCRRTRRACGSA